jgi:hypothetical protein
MKLKGHSSLVSTSSSCPMSNMYANYDYGGPSYPYRDPYVQPTIPGAHRQGTPFPGYGGTTLPTADAYGPPAWGAPGHAPLGRPKHHQPSNDTYFGRKNPMKSAMKRGADGGTVPLARVRTTSDSRQSFSSMRQRQAPFIPGIYCAALVFLDIYLCATPYRIPLFIISRYRRISNG